MEGFPIVKFETVAAEVDIVITTTGNKDNIRVEHMAAMKNNCIVGNIGHFDNEIQMDALEAATKRTNIKPQVRPSPSPSPSPSSRLGLRPHLRGLDSRISRRQRYPRVASGSLR